MTVVVDIFRVLASCTSMAMILSPVPMILKVLRTKHTGYASIVPLVSMLTNVHVLMMFGYLTEQYFPVFSTFVAGDLIALVYVVIFYWYSHEKPKAHKVFLLYGVPYVVLSIYAVVGGVGATDQTRNQVGDIIGYFSIVTGIIVFSSPLEKVRPVLKHRSAVFLPIHMIYAGTLNNLMWVVYSSLTSRWIIFAPNAFSLVSGCFQISLYWIYHPSTHPMDASLLPTTKTNGTDLETGGDDTGSHSSTSPASPEFVLLQSPLQLQQANETTK